MANVLQLADLTRPGHPRRAQAAALVEAARRPDHRLEPRRPATPRSIVELKQWTEVGRSNITDCVTVDYGGRPRDAPPPVAPGRAVPALPPRHAPGVHRRAGDRARRLRLPALRAARPEVAALPRRLRDAPRHEPVVRRRPDATRSRPSSTHRVAGPDEGAHPRARRQRPPSARTSACSTTSPASSATSRSSRCSTNSRSPTTRSWIRSAAPARTSRRSRSSSQGGPGTGKSVIAVNLVAELSDARPPDAPRHRLEGVHREPAQDRRRPRRRAVQVLPRHRDRRRAARRRRSSTRRTASGRSAPAASRPRRRARARPRSTTSSTPAASSVFFIDDLQVVRPGEVGSTDLIREAAAKRSLEVREFELEAQFRSNGSDSFIQWVDNTLELDRTPQVLWPMDDEFDFRIVGSVQRARHADPRQGRGGGDRPARRRLLLAVVRPRRRRRARARRQGRGLVDALERAATASAAWRPASRSPTSGRATQEGIDQVGCVYTAQGFEFDYVGVIFGPDLVYRPMDGGWVGQRDQSHDRVVRRGVTEPAVHRLRQEHLPRPPDPRPPRLLRLLHGRADAGLRPEPDRGAAVRHRKGG